MKLADAATACMRCGFCKAVCPVHLSSDGSERSSPRARVRLAKAFAAGDIDLTPALAREMSHCINCKACVSECPSGVEVDRIILEMRRTLIERQGLSAAKRIIFNGVLSHPHRLLAAARVVGGLSLVANPFRSVFPLLGLPKDKRLPPIGGRSFRESVPEVAEPVGALRMTVAFFPGCSGDLVYPGIARAAWRVMRELGCRVIVPRDFVCCGTPVMNSGDFDGARRLAMRNLEVLSRLKVDAIVTACGSCGLTISREWGELLGLAVPEGLSAMVTDISSLVLRLLDRPLRLPSPIRVTYHDSCHLRRGMGVFSEPRSLISSIEGVELVEMSNPDRCCGGGGAYSIYHPDISRLVGSEKAAAIAATGAQTVITGCPACVMQLDECLSLGGAPVRAMHTIQLIGEAIS